MATTKNLIIDQGATFTEYIEYLDNSKNPISLSGYTISSEMRRSYPAANSIVFTSAIIDAANGNVQVSLVASATANLKSGRYLYDVLATSGNIVLRIIEGIVTVNPGVTHG
jgi:hypothetical protein